MKTYGGMKLQLHSFLSSELDEGEWSASRPGRLISKEKAFGTHWIGGGVPGFVWIQWRKEKATAPRGNRTPVVQPVSLVTMTNLSRILFYTRKSVKVKNLFYLDSDIGSTAKHMNFSHLQVAGFHCIFGSDNPCVP
jgi:hypothetical protein